MGGGRNSHPAGEKKKSLLLLPSTLIGTHKQYSASIHPSICIVYIPILQQSSFSLCIDFYPSSNGLDNRSVDFLRLFVFFSSFFFFFYYFPIRSSNKQQPNPPPPTHPLRKEEKKNNISSAHRKEAVAAQHFVFVWLETLAGAPVWPDRKRIRKKGEILYISFPVSSFVGHTFFLSLPCVPRCQYLRTRKVFLKG
jgi:hypothetical protein